MSYIVLWEWFHPARVRNLQEPQAASCGIVVFWCLSSMEDSSWAMWAMASCEKAQHTVQSSCPMLKRRFVFPHVNGLVLIQKFSTVFSNFLFTVLQTLIKAPFPLSKHFLYNIHTLMNTSRATPLSASYPWLLWHTDWSNKGSKHQSSDHNVLYLLSRSHPVCSPVCPRMKSLAVLLSFVFLNLCTCCKKPFVYSLSEFLYLDPHSTYTGKEL